MDRHLLRHSGGPPRQARGVRPPHFDLKVDFAKLTGWSSLEGATGVAGVRYGDGLNANNFVGGKQWRLMPFLLTYTTPELFEVKRLPELSGAWANPYDIFAQEMLWREPHPSCGREGLGRGDLKDACSLKA
jgi:hypothetical protein